MRTTITIILMTLLLTACAQATPEISESTGRVAALDAMLTTTAQAETGIEVAPAPTTPQPETTTMEQPGTEALESAAPSETVATPAPTIAPETEAAPTATPVPPQPEAQLQAQSQPETEPETETSADAQAAPPETPTETPPPAPTATATINPEEPADIADIIEESAEATPTPEPTATPEPVDDDDDMGQPSSKKGLAAPFDTPSCQDTKLTRSSWYYNWLIHPDPGCAVNSSFVPRMWGRDDLGRLDTAINNAKPSGWLIGFNEPNLPWQADMSPEEGAELWRQIEEAAREEDIKLVSPAPNQDVPGRFDEHGNQWLWAMVDAYEGLYGEKPHFDAIGWHIYDPDPGAMKEYLRTRRDEARARGYNVDIWVLEYNGCFVEDDPEAVIEEMIPWFEDQDWIDRYAWYLSRPGDDNPDAFNNCILVDPRSGELTELGEFYRQH